ncbi:hypothetical protein MJM99_28580, partial [Salmonella enterica subsp. enterica serovar Kentucky]|nr:hypothetical protein [Salmonella enterica subsp. enterica serovar Kentucky]
PITVLDSGTLTNNDSGVINSDTKVSGNLVNDGTISGKLTQNGPPFKVGGRKNDPASFVEVEKGQLTFRNAADLYLYPNTLVVVKA